jgi:parallel beta-helix repeat protein
MDGNLVGGILVDGGAVSTTIEGNAARGNGGDGFHVMSAGSVVRNNLARSNQGWGIYAAPGVVDGGANGASGNAEAAQCYLIFCNDGSNWRAPVRPPEPLDPLEIGLPTLGAPGPRGLPARRSRRRNRLAVVVCMPRRAALRAGVRRWRRARVICKAPYKARRTSRRVTGSLMRHGRARARGSRHVRGGGRGMVTMRARRRLAGRYRLVLGFRDARGGKTVVRRAVRVRQLGD